MNKPNAKYHNPDPAYLRGLIESSGFSQNYTATRIGIAPRSIRQYLSGDRPIPYSVQYAVEQLAGVVRYECERCGFVGAFIDEGETCPKCFLVQ